MKKSIFTLSPWFLILVAGLSLALASCAGGGSKPETTNTEAPAAFNTDSAETAVLLARFDSLDYDVYTHQKWDSLQISHADNIVVHYPDGRTTTGLADHIKELKPLFVFAPDTRIQEHPIKFGLKGWTSVIGVMEGTFSQPMPIGNGKTIPPTGKKFKLSMSTVGHWKDGKMIEEYLFWDNQALMQQIGLAK